MTAYPRPPAHIDPYVRVLGEKGTIEFLMTFGGGEVYLTCNPKGRSRLAEVIGLEKAAALAEAIPNLKVRVPTAKPWIACCLKSEGLPTAEIARRLHTADNTIRRWLSSGDAISGDTVSKTSSDPRQLPLL